MQARSTITVEAILQATLQVLCAVGKQRLTTTRVAARAGVSVGTLYQYFPNKTSLLQATLQHHMDGVAAAVEQVCTEQRGKPLRTMAVALVHSYLAAKMADAQASAALYAISSDVEGQAIAQAVGRRAQQSLAQLLATSSNRLTRDPLLVASMLQGTMAGLSRNLLEAATPPGDIEPWRTELITALCAYLETCQG